MVLILRAVTDADDDDGHHSTTTRATYRQYMTVTDSLQLSSSEPSPQSSSASQTDDAGIQRPVLEHLNWSSRHATHS